MIIAKEHLTVEGRLKIKSLKDKSAAPYGTAPSGGVLRLQGLISLGLILLAHSAVAEMYFCVVKKYRLCTYDCLAYAF